MDVNALKQGAATLERDVAPMKRSAEALVESWADLRETYVTSHTRHAIVAMRPLPLSAAAVSDASTEIAWVLNRYADELAACDRTRNALVAEIKNFTGQSWVSEKALIPLTDEFWKNIALHRHVAVLRQRIVKAEQRCVSSLEGISMNPYDADPYDNLEWIFSGGNRLTFWDRRDVFPGDFSAPLFGNSGVISGNQVSQGDLGNCWFLSTMAAIADKDPDAIERMVRENPDGTYSVSLYVDGEWQSIEVDATMLLDDNGIPVFSGRTANDNNALWPMIIEKAAIKALGGDYTSLVAGTGAKAMEMFTGNDAVDDFITPNNAFDTEAIANYAAASEREGVVMTANSNLSVIATETIYARATNDVPISVQISNNHVYQVSNIDANGDVTLVNPHNAHREVDGFDADEFVLTAEQFQEQFMGLSVGSTL